MEVLWASFGGDAAAGIVTLVAVIVGECIRWRLLQPKLVISVGVGFVYPEDDANKMFFEARNPRVHPVTVAAFGLDIRNDKNVRMQVNPREGCALPYEIAGGKSMLQWTDTKNVIESHAKSDNKPSDINYAWFRTSAGKEFRGKLEKSTVKFLDSNLAKV